MLKHLYQISNYSLPVALLKEIRGYLKALLEFLNQFRRKVIGPRVRYIKTRARNTQQLSELFRAQLETS